MTTATLNVATWTHPKTGELRVYLNVDGLHRSVKVFFTEGPDVAGEPQALAHVNDYNRTLGPVGRLAVDASIEDAIRACDHNWNILVEMAS